MNVIDFDNVGDQKRKSESCRLSTLFLSDYSLFEKIMEILSKPNLEV